MTKKRKVIVQLSKTIQEVDFEPFNLVLGEMVDISEDENPVKVRKRIYEKVENQLDRLINKRWKKTEPKTGERSDD